MALESNTLAQAIIAELENRGFDASNAYSQVTPLAQAIAIAVVSHIETNAEVIISGGSSAGVYKVT